MNGLYHVFRVGWQHNKWLVVIPADKLASTKVEDCLPVIVEAVKAKYDCPVTSFDHVEYLGKG